MKQKLTEEILENGFFEDEHEYQCIYCGKITLKDQIYPLGNDFFNGAYAMKDHILKEHGGPLRAILNLPSEESGLSKTQKNLMTLLSLDLTDNEIAEQLEISPSTIRNHRFKLKEKKKQALYFLAAINLLEEVNKKMTADEASIFNYDDRFNISEKEREDVIKNFIEADGTAKTIPRKEKSKIILLQYLAKDFLENKTYSEKEVNEIIQKRFADFVTIRRYLIQYGILARTNDGGKYWKL